jgi:hypothetical protein
MFQLIFLTRVGIRSLENLYRQLGRGEGLAFSLAFAGAP